MPIAATLDLLRLAQAGGYAVPAFNVIGLEHAEAIVRSAEASRAPVILQISENAIRYHFGAVEPIGTACRELAKAAATPVALHLDHATAEALCERAVAVGFSSVMLDAPDVGRTAALVAWAHDRAVAVEAVLGVVGGKDGVATTTGGLTEPAEAEAFVAATGADALAVAVGTSHGMQVQTARIDLARLARIRASVPVPLVLHGSSGVPHGDLRAAASAGATKINLATTLNVAFTAAIRRALVDADVVDPRRYLAEGRRAIEGVVADLMRLLGAVGRA